MTTYVHNISADSFSIECQQSYTKKAEEMNAVSLARAMETVEKLEVKLEGFAKTHKHEIQHDPAFRAKFLEMCAPLGKIIFNSCNIMFLIEKNEPHFGVIIFSLGVDPLSAEKGFWGNMLGIGEFYYELSVKVAEVCLASRSRNGGIIR